VIVKTEGIGNVTLKHDKDLEFQSKIFTPFKKERERAVFE
jgi:hypothetical protein